MFKPGKGKKMPNQTIIALRTAAKEYQRCHLYKNATQTVFGAGPTRAKLMIVGEIPGKREDESGEPDLATF